MKAGTESALPTHNEHSHPRIRTCATGNILQNYHLQLNRFLELLSGDCSFKSSGFYRLYQTVYCWANRRVSNLVASLAAPTDHFSQMIKIVMRQWHLLHHKHWGILLQIKSYNAERKEERYEQSGVILSCCPDY